MSSFLDKVNKGLEKMGKAPYDDKKTIDYIDKETEKVVGIYNKLKNNKVSKEC